MLRKSHPTCLLLLLAIFNKVFSTGTYPLQWLSSLVLSFPKPGKSPTLEENLRPISLTSCVGKQLEKILNTRLAMVLESSGVLPAHQFGFRRIHSTHEALNRFISDVAGALNAKQEVVCVSFDIRKAYDTTWRFGILQTLMLACVVAWLARLYLCLYLSAGTNFFCSFILEPYSFLHQPCFLMCSLLSTHRWKAFLKLPHG